MKTAVENCCHCECDTPVRERDPATLRPGDVAVTSRELAASRGAHATRSGATAVAPAPAAPGAAAPPPSDGGSAELLTSDRSGLAASLALQAAMLFLLAGRGGNPRAKPGLVHDRTFASFVNGVQPEAPQLQPAFEGMIMRTARIKLTPGTVPYTTVNTREPHRLAAQKD